MAEKSKAETVMANIRLPADLDKRIQGQVDGLRYTSRTHFIIVAVANELARAEFLPIAGQKDPK